MIKLNKRKLLRTPKPPEDIDPSQWVESWAARRELDDVSRQSLRNFADAGHIRVIRLSSNRKLYNWADVREFAAGWSRPTHGKQPD